jgi:hypothetical protein
VRITVQVSVDTQDHTEPVVCEVFTLERDALAVDLVGLHLAEAHELVTALQEVLVGARISQALAQRRCCARCGRAYRHKDTKKITLRTLFGTLDIDSPRWISCPCQSGAMASFSPLATALAEHATPELVYLQARFAAVMSYAQARPFGSGGDHPPECPAIYAATSTGPPVWVKPGYQRRKGAEGSLSRTWGSDKVPIEIVRGSVLDADGRSPGTRVDDLPQI